MDNKFDCNGKIPNIEKAFSNDKIAKQVAYMMATSHEYKEPNTTAAIKMTKNYKWELTKEKIKNLQGIHKPIKESKVSDMVKNFKPTKPFIVVNQLHGIRPQTPGKKILLDGHHRKECCIRKGIEEVPVYKGTYTGGSEKSIAELIEKKASEKKSPFKRLKDNEVPLTSEERATVMKSKATWNHGKNSSKSPAVWKSENPKDGTVTYITNTHRAYNTAPTLKGAIGKYHSFIKKTASEEIDDLYKLASEYKGPKKPNGEYAIPHDWYEPGYDNETMEWLHSDLGYPRHYKPIASNYQGSDIVMDTKDKNNALKIWDHRDTVENNVNSPHLSEKDIKKYYSTVDTKFVNKMVKSGIPIDSKDGRKAIDNLTNEELKPLGYSRAREGMKKAKAVYKSSNSTKELGTTGAMVGAAIGALTGGKSIKKSLKGAALGGALGGTASAFSGFNALDKQRAKKIMSQDSHETFKEELKGELGNEVANRRFLSQYK